jgi:hypothetical protein
LLYFISIGLSYIAYAGRKRHKLEDRSEDLETAAGQGGA